MNPLLVWVTVIIITVLIEAASMSLHSIWFSVGAIAALIAASLGMNVGAQLTVFVLFSAVLLVLVRPLCQKVLKPRGSATNADRILNHTAIVTEEINNNLATGAIKVFGQEWTARAAVDNIIPAGKMVIVQKIEGVKAIVALSNEEE